MSTFDHTDGLENAFTGLGGANDKGQAGQWVASPLLARDEVETMYTDNDIAATIVDAFPDDAIRAGWKVQTGDDEAEEDAEDETGKSTKDPWEKFFRDHDLFNKIAQASKWARLYGGAALVLGIADGKDPWEEVDWDNVKAITWIQVVDMYELVPCEFETDFTKAEYNKPRTYHLFPSGPGGLVSDDTGDVLGLTKAKPDETRRVIHRSRVIRFEGDPVPRNLAGINGYWGMSVLQKTRKKIEQFTAVEQAMANRIQESQYDVVKFKGLGETLDQEDGEAKVQKRVMTMNRGKGMIKALIIDAEDDWETRQATYSGLHEIYSAFATSLAAAAHMSKMRLFGEPPGGLSADDKAGRANWHDQVDTYREDKWRPGLERIIELAMRSKQGPTNGQLLDEWVLMFGDLEQLTPLEEALVRKTYAELDHLNWQMSVYSGQEIRTSRYAKAEFGTEIVLDDDVDDPDAFDVDPEVYEPTAPPMEEEENVDD